MTNHEEPGADSLVGHLTELRVRLFRSLIAAFIGMLICYNFTDAMFEWIRHPIAPYLPAGGLVFTAPMDKFVAHLKIALFGGILMAFPFIAYQIWKFVAPGLYQNEKKYATAFIFFGSSLFALGIAFTYYVVFPMAFKFLMGYGGDIDKPMITIGEYMSFFVTTSLAFGAAFELPLVIVILGLMDIVSQKFLKEKRRYAVLAIAVLSGIITPPDLLSMVMMMAPLWVLYEIAVIVVGFFERRKRKALNEPEEPIAPI